MSENLDLVATLNKAAAQYRSGAFDDVISTCETVLSHVPDQPDTLNLYALATRATKKWRRAEDIARRGLSVHPRHAALNNTLGLIALDQFRLAEACDAFEAAVRYNPAQPEFRLNLVRTLHEQGHLDAAQNTLAPVIETAPEQPQAYLLRASLEIEAGNFAAARADLDEAQRRGARPDDVASARARCALADGDLDVAFEYFSTAVQTANDVADARVNRGTIRLLQGRLKEGWDDYNMRHFRRWGRSVARPLPFPSWTGESLEGKSILLWAEQGLGEAVLCSTMLPDIMSEAEHVFVECDERLQTLLHRSFPGVDVIVRPDSSLDTKVGIEADFHASLLDVIIRRVPGAAEEPPRPAAVKADQERSSALRSKYLSQSGGKPLVGASWASPRAAGSRLKSLDLDLFAQLLSVPDVSFVNLQYGNDRQALSGVAQTCGAAVIEDTSIDHGGSLIDVADQVAALDLVVTVSNTTAHLAGALGCETWVIIPPPGPAAMWYWFMDRVDSPWYPNVRLVRRHYGAHADRDLLAGLGRDLDQWRASR